MLLSSARKSKVVWVLGCLVKSKTKWIWGINYKERLENREIDCHLTNDNATNTRVTKCESNYYKDILQDKASSPRKFGQQSRSCTQQKLQQALCGSYEHEQNQSVKHILYCPKLLWLLSLYSRSFKDQEFFALNSRSLICTKPLTRL